jgi:hypothetical protein
MKAAFFQRAVLISPSSGIFQDLQKRWPPDRSLAHYSLFICGGQSCKRLSLGWSCFKLVKNNFFSLTGNMRNFLRNSHV